MQVISSKDNETIKNIRKLKEKKYRDLENAFIVEGIKLVEEAIEENATIKQIVVCEGCINDGTWNQEMRYKIAKYECIYVTEKVFNLLSDVKTPPGILAVIEKKSNSSKIDYSQDIIVALDGIQDPGNLGTMVRTGEGAGISGVIMNQTTVDLFNPKTIRSTMGSIYRVPFYVASDLKETISDLKKQGIKVYAAHLKGTLSYDEPDYKEPTAFMIGNEGNGLSDEIADLADTYIKIPMEGKVESLNAAISATLLMYETNRQRRH